MLFCLSSICAGLKPPLHVIITLPVSFTSAATTAYAVYPPLTLCIVAAQAAHELQKSGADLFALEDIDFGRRYAMEKEIRAAGL